MLTLRSLKRTLLAFPAALLCASFAQAQEERSLKDDAGSTELYPLGREEHSTALSLTREEAVLRALARNYVIQIESLERPIADAEMLAAQATFDPGLEVDYNYGRQGAEGTDRDNESSEVSAGLRATLPTGTRIFVGIDTSDTFSIDSSESFFDSATAFSGLTITQPILEGFGFAGTGYRVRIARGQVRQTEAQLQATVAAVISDTIAAFQNARFASKNLEIAIRNRELATQLLRDNEVRVRMGTMASLDRIQAEAEAALREVAVLNARNQKVQAINALKGLILNDPSSVMDTEFRLIPSQAPEFTEPDFQQDLMQALADRPELMSAEAASEIAELRLKSTRRNALPRLDLTASLGRRAFADSMDQALGDSFSSGESAHSIGAVFRVPLPNRSGRAERTIAALRRNQAILARDATEQSIRIDLGNAISALRTDYQRIQAATRARELAEQALDAEERKLQVGNSSTFIVLRLQGDLAFAEAREAAAQADFTTSHADYLRAKGALRSRFLNLETEPMP